MLTEMTPSELGEWIADYEISPWGEWRADWRAAQNTRILAEVNRNRAAHGEPFQVQDFMFDHLSRMQDKVNRDAQLSAKIRASLMALNVKRKK